MNSLLICNFKERLHIIFNQNPKIMENIKFEIAPYQDELQLLIDGTKAGYMSIEIDGRLLIVYYTKLEEEHE